MIWGSIQFDFAPAAFLIVLILPLVWGFFFLYHYRQETLESFASASLLDSIMVKRLSAVFWVKSALICLAWICCVIALMQPKGNERYISSGAEKPQDINQKAILRKKHHEVIILLDASASMGTADTRSGKPRDVVAKEIADDVISSLKGESVSLYAFTSAAMQIVPSTMDYLFTRLMLRQVEVNEGESSGTDIKNALETVRNKYFSDASSSQKTLLVLTDGGDTSLEGLTGEERRAAIDKIIKPIEGAEHLSLRVLTVGIGSKEGANVPGVSYQGHPVISALEEPLLRKMSLVGRGDFWAANAITPFQVSQAISSAIARDETYIDEEVNTQLPSMDTQTHLYDLFFKLPLGIALVALALWFLIPDTDQRKRFPLLKDYREAK